MVSAPAGDARTRASAVVSMKLRSMVIPYFQLGMSAPALIAGPRGARFGAHMPPLPAASQERRATTPRRGSQRFGAPLCRRRSDEVLVDYPWTSALHARVWCCT